MEVPLYYIFFPTAHWSWLYLIDQLLTSSNLLISFLNYIIFCLILLFQHRSSLLFAVGFLTPTCSLFATMILAATTNSLLVSSQAYHPEASKFPLFICLEPYWVFKLSSQKQGNYFAQIWTQRIRGIPSKTRS